MKMRLAGRCPSALSLLGALAGLMPMAAHAGKEIDRQSPPYTVMVALEVRSPFVGDGRMTFADLAFSATFRDMVFVFDPRALLAVCSVEGQGGTLHLTRREFNDVQEGDDRHRPWVKKEWPKEFAASLGTAPSELRKYAPTGKDDLPLVPLAPPPKVKLRFRAEFGLLDLQWYSKLGSSALSDMYLDFDVPWLQLLDGKPLTLKLPYEGSDAEEKGEWWIEFIPKRTK
jgi:hypothetical protein